MRITLGITGASGAIYAHRLLYALSSDSRVSTIYIVCTKSGREVWDYELPDFNLEELCDRLSKDTKLEFLASDSFFTPIASGSNCADAMVIAPCSMGTIGRIASGVSSNLMERAADVQLKERMPLVICFRECPLSLIHLRNLTTLSEAGAIVMPAAPSFYSQPKTIEDAVETVVERILDKIGLKSEKNFRWIEK